MPQLRLVAFAALLTMAITACGGGTEQAPNETTGETTGETSSGTTIPGDEGSGEGSGSTPGSEGPAGPNSITYTISDGYEASGTHTLIPAMTFFSDGVWSLSFGDESGALLLVNLDPSTPSINFTDGTTSVSGDISQCDFEVTRQDESGAAGSFSCANVAMVNEGTLGEAGHFSGSFEANP